MPLPPDQLIQTLRDAVNIFNDPKGLGDGNYDKLKPFYDPNITMGRVDDSTFIVGAQNVIDNLNQTQLDQLPHFNPKIKINQSDPNNSNPRVVPSETNHETQVTLAGGGTYIDNTLVSNKKTWQITYVFGYAKDQGGNWVLLNATAKRV